MCHSGGLSPLMGVAHKRMHAQATYQQEECLWLA